MRLGTSSLVALLPLMQAFACMAQTPLPRTGWTTVADSQETLRANNAAANALDGDTATFWHSKWTDTPSPLPHFITVSFGASKSINGITYLPRQDGAKNGNIGACPQNNLLHRNKPCALKLLIEQLLEPAKLSLARTFFRLHGRYSTLSFLFALRVLQPFSLVLQASMRYASARTAPRFRQPLLPPAIGRTPRR